MEEVLPQCGAAPRVLAQLVKRLQAGCHASAGEAAAEVALVVQYHPEEVVRLPIAVLVPLLHIVFGFARSHGKSGAASVVCLLLKLLNTAAQQTVAALTAIFLEGEITVIDLGLHKLLAERNSQCFTSAETLLGRLVRYGVVKRHVVTDAVRIRQKVLLRQRSLSQSG